MSTNCRIAYETMLHNTIDCLIHDDWCEDAIMNEVGLSEEEFDRIYRKQL